MTFHVPVVIIPAMEAGEIVEYIDSQKIITAVILEEKNERLRLLTEANREINLSSTRLVYKGGDRIDPSVGKQKLIDVLKITAYKRNALIKKIDIKELWELFHSEQEWIDLDTMTGLCFAENPTCDHKSAVVRAFFNDRLYFKFDNGRFFPHSEQQVTELIERKKEEERKNSVIESGSNWLREIIEGKPINISSENMKLAEILKSFYLYEQDSDDYALGKVILSKTGISDNNQIFNILVKIGLFEKDENIDLLRSRIPRNFPNKVLARADELVRVTNIQDRNHGRKDMTCLPLITIDGQGTLDYDDGISIEQRGDHYFLGIHISDVGHYVRRGDSIDQEALNRGSSIYMPDAKIPMLPPPLAESLCSLKAGEVRPAVSVMVKLNRSSEILAYTIVPSIIRVKHQLTYYDVNMMADENREIMMLRDITKQLRQNRLAHGAIHISLPDINITVGEGSEILVSAINRESPSRILVEELMILANTLMAKFLVEKNFPAIFRSQPDPRERLYKGNNGTLYQNYAQRKLLSRFVLDHKPERHSGLAADAYITATSPIRKYFDLVTQRQIRAAFNMEVPYTANEIDHLLQVLEPSMTHVFKMQYIRKRYWLLKYLEKQIGSKHQAIVIQKRRHNYQVLLPEYMLECNLPQSSGLELKPEDLIQVTLQHVNARQDTVSIFMEY